MKSKKYTDEFKIQAVKLAEELGSITEASRQLGIGDVNIHNWRKKFSKNVVVSATRKPEVKPDEQTKEILGLQQEVIHLKKVNHILKSAAAFFSQDHLK